MTKLTIIKLITAYALQYGVDPHVAVSVAAVESNFNPTTIGVTGDIGVFQLNPRSFPAYTTEQLMNTKLNIKLGVQYLANVKKQCKYQDDINWLVCYNYGVRNTSQRVKHPALFPYVKKVRVAMRSMS